MLKSKVFFTGAGPSDVHLAIPLPEGCKTAGRLGRRAKPVAPVLSLVAAVAVFFDSLLVGPK